MRKVIVSASTEYAVLIGRGLLAQLGTEVAKRIRPCKAAVITDTTVEKLYAEPVDKSSVGELAGVNLTDRFLYICFYLLCFPGIYCFELSDKQEWQCF